MLGTATLAGLPPSAWACAACFGRSDSKLAEGMNMGIFSLLLVVLLVLSGVAAFFIYLARRASTLAGPKVAAADSLPPTSQS
jgi:hypothetical protein